MSISFFFKIQKVKRKKMRKEGRSPSAIFFYKNFFSRLDKMAYFSLEKLAQDFAEHIWAIADCFD